MNKILPLSFVVALLLGSCQYIDKQIPSEDELLKREMESIDWKQVDEYPSFAVCDSLTTKSDKKDCFFDQLNNLIQEKLSNDTPAVLYPKVDTIQVLVTISPDATMTFEPRLKADSLQYDTKKVDSILRSKLVDFPVVSPAIKRGIPVKTQFEIPVALKVQ